MSKIDVSHKINISASGFTNGLTITESNNIIYINGYIRFDSTKNINTVIGNHSFDLKYKVDIPAFVYGAGYVGGFGMITLKTNGYINLLAYSSDNIQEVDFNGCGILN